MRKAAPKSGTYAWQTATYPGVRSNCSAGGGDGSAVGNSPHDAVAATAAPAVAFPLAAADNSYDVDYDPPCTGLLDRAGPVPCWVPVTAVQTRKAGGSRRGRNTCRLGSVEMWLSSKYFEGPGTVSIICEKLHMGHDTVLHVLINVLVCIREARRTGAAPCGERWAQQGHAAGQCR
jgi:hypothetical protein